MHATLQFDAYHPLGSFDDERRAHTQAIMINNVWFLLLFIPDLRIARLYMNEQVNLS